MSMFGKAKELEPVSKSSDRTLVNFARVFLYMFILIAITGGVAFGLGYVIATSYAKAIEGGGDTTAILNTYLGLIIGSSIALFIMVLVINFVFIRGKHSVVVPSIIYAVLVGVLISSFTIWMDWVIIGTAFAITAGIFAIMALIAYFTKGNMSPLLMMGLGLIIGVVPLILINLFLGSTMVSWIVSFVIFAAIMFITMFDIWRIKKIAEQGYMNKNLSYYCAFVMYVDFINIFIRILYFLATIYGKK